MGRQRVKWQIAKSRLTGAPIDHHPNPNYLDRVSLKRVQGFANRTAGGEDVIDDQDPRTRFKRRSTPELAARYPIRATLCVSRLDP